MSVHVQTPAQAAARAREEARELGAQVAMPPVAAPPEPEVEALLRMAAEGQVMPLPVELPPLPEDATQNMRTVAEFFRRVRALRLAVEDDRPVPFATWWVGKHCGLPGVDNGKMAAWRTLWKLEAAGVLVKADPLPGRGKRGVSCYLPGDPAATATMPADDDRARTALAADSQSLAVGDHRPALRAVGA